MPLVSVIMPVYNGEKYLAEAIESILAQTFTDFELLIVDDGSEDGSAEIIQNFTDCDARIRLLRHRKNRGRADARNTGIAAADGVYFTSMDCDDVSPPERLRKQVDFLESNSKIDAVGTWGMVMNKDLSSHLYSIEIPTRHPLIAFDTFLGYGVLGATVMMRRGIARAVGGYEPGRRYVDDLELMARLLHDTDMVVANLPEYLLIYRRHDQLKHHDIKVSTAVRTADRNLRQRTLERIWGEAPEATLERFKRLQNRASLNWADRQAARRDLKRLIESMIVHGWVEPEDKPLLIAEMNRRLEQASPRIWQQFRRWRRHRLGF